MKRKIIAVAATLFLCIGIANESIAQKSSSPVTPFRQGSVTLNLGVGFGNDYKNDFGNRSTFGTKAALEFGIWKAGPGVVSLGAEVGATTSNKSNRNYNDEFKANTIVVGGRSAWHYGWKVAGLDTYGGVSAGAAFYHYNYNYSGGARTNYNDVFPVLGGFVGASYFFTPAFGVNAEAGFDITSLQAGVIFKFK